jgi:hypothetical protein
MLQLNYFSLIKKLLSTFFILIVSNSLLSQAVISPALSPQVHWKHNFNPTTDMFGAQVEPDDEDLVDDDWFFDLEEISNQWGESLGYIAVGYSRDRNLIETTFRNQNDVELDCFGNSISSNLACKDFETSDRRKGLMRQVAVFYDLNGNVINYFRYNQGELYGVIQDGDYFYLVGNAWNPLELTRSDEVQSSNEPQLNGVPIYYNPTNSLQQQFDVDAGFSYTCIPDVPFDRKFNVIKIDWEGNVIWNNYYGLEDNINSAFALGSEARSIVLKGNSLVAVGRSNFSGIDQQFVTRINKNTGYLEWKTALASTTGNINEIYKWGNYYALSGQTTISIGGNPSVEGFVCAVESPTLLEADFASPLFYKTTSDVIGTPPLTGLSIDTDSTSSSTSAIINNGKLIWFLMLNNSFGFFAGPNIVKDPVIIEFDISGNVTDHVVLDELRAYDMWMSGIPTDDGGFAMVSSRHSPTYFLTGNNPGPTTLLDIANPSGPTIADCSPGTVFGDPGFCTEIEYFGTAFYSYISTCAYVAKFNSDLEMEWDKIWDSSNNAPRECFPGNLKQQECLYRIIQSSDDGGLVICGNTSDNFDDGYIVKLASDCSIQPFVPYVTQVDPDVIFAPATGVYTISSNTTWNTPKKVLGRVHIEPGIRLTIQNTTVEFAANTDFQSRIDVDLDAELVVDNSTLQQVDGCQMGWDGLHAWSDPTNHQEEISGYRDQGFIRLKNNTTITGAKFAVNNFGNGSLGGGVIQASNTIFENNYRDARFHKYSNFSPSNPSTLRSDKSQFNECDFIINNGYDGLTEPLDRVTLWDVRRVDFLGCDFLNEETKPLSNQRDAGIRSADAFYVVQNYCDGAVDIDGNCLGTETTSSFDGFYHGIVSQESMPNRPVFIYDATFSDNLMGVQIEQVSDDFTMVGNNFIMGGHPLSPDVNEREWRIHAGIVIEGVGSNYTIDLNTFTGAGSEDTYGTSIINSGEYDNFVEENDFEDLTFANFARGVNRNDGSGIFGLEYYCNGNSGNSQDFYVINDPGEGTVDNGIGANQGLSSFEADNTFSANTNPGSFQHFFINPNCEGSTYYHGSAANETPIDFNAQVTVTAVSPGATSNCGDDVPGEGFAEGKSGEDGDLAYLVQFRDLLAEYQLLSDGGSTESLLNDLETAEDETQRFLTADLVSPYLSANALETILTHQWLGIDYLQQLIWNNPRLANNADLLTYLDATQDEGMASTLLTGATELLQNDERHLMELELNQMGNDLHRINNERIRGVYLDSPGYSINALLDARLAALDVRQYYSAIMAHWEAESEETWSLLEALPYEFQLSERQLDEWSGVQNYLYFLDELRMSDTPINSLNQEQMASLIAIADNPSGGASAGWASNALCFHYGICKEGEGIQALPAKSYAANDFELPIANRAQSADYRISPNPSEGYTQVFGSNAEDRIIGYVIYDVNGREVLAINGSSAFDAVSLPNGVYFCRITTLQGSTENLKFIVNH